MILGFAGRAGAGKTTAARVFEECYGYRVLSFAGPVKHEVRSFLDKLNVRFAPRHLYGVATDKEEELSMSGDQYGAALERLPAFNSFDATICTKGLCFTPRSLMQWWGDYRKASDPNYWVTQAQEVAEGFLERDCSVVFDDVRFPNEAEMIRTLGGGVVKIMRHEDSHDTHNSETALDDYPHFAYHLLNRGTAAQFQMTVMGWAEPRLL
jgi:hypothetical protein